ncbi:MULTISPECIES: hypothetical protein [Clostridium]|nr:MULTISPECIES: hypothetical protein [Clostridium]
MIKNLDTKKCIEEDADWLIFEVDIDEDKAKLLNRQFITQRLDP